MNEKNNFSSDSALLRISAEKIANEKPAVLMEKIDMLTHEGALHIIHELQIHQIELEMQNNELRQAYAELDAVRDRYFNLYDLAPVGYCTLSEKGLILESNLTAATLIGTNRSALAGEPFHRFIFKDDQDLHYLYQKKLLETNAPQACELRMVKMDNTIFCVRLNSFMAHNKDGTVECRVAIGDNTDCKLALKYFI